MKRPETVFQRTRRRIQRRGIVVGVRVSLTPKTIRLMWSRGLYVPRPVWIRAMIDTGSDCTGIVTGFMKAYSRDAYDLMRKGNTNINTTKGDRLSVVYSIQMRIGYGEAVRQVQEVDISSKHQVMCIIGRDLLRYARFFYNGPKNRCRIKFVEGATLKELPRSTPWSRALQRVREWFLE